MNELKTFQQLRNVITGLGVYDDIGDIDFTQSQLGIDDVAHGIFVSQKISGEGLAQGRISVEFQGFVAPG